MNIYQSNTYRKDLNWQHLNRVCVSVLKNNTSRDVFNIKEELQSFKMVLVNNLTVSPRHFFAEVNLFKSDILTPYAPITNTPLSHSEKFINYLLDQVSFLREQI